MPKRKGARNTPSPVPEEFIECLQFSLQSREMFIKSRQDVIDYLQIKIAAVNEQCMQLHQMAQEQNRHTSECNSAPVEPSKKKSYLKKQVDIHHKEIEALEAQSKALGALYSAGEGEYENGPTSACNSALVERSKKKSYLEKQVDIHDKKIEVLDTLSTTLWALHRIGDDEYEILANIVDQTTLPNVGGANVGASTSSGQRTNVLPLPGSTSSYRYHAPDNNIDPNHDEEDL